MKCLVLGGGGFIGSSVVTKLIQAGHDVLVMTRTEKPKNIANNILSDVEFIYGDIRNLSQIETASKKCELIFHFAGVVNSDAASKLNVETIQTEIDGLQNVCKSMIKNNVEKVVYASSCSVYGDDECAERLTEVSPVFPQSHYAVVKRMGELMLKAYHEEHKLESAILRVFNPYGINQPKNMVIHRFFDAAINNRPIQIYGNGAQTRDFIYIDDVADATVLAGVNINQAEIVNVCTGVDKSIYEVAKTIISMTGSTAGCSFLSLPNGRAEAELSRSFGSNKKLNSLTGFIPKIKLEQGLKNMYEQIMLRQNSDRF